MLYKDDSGLEIYDNIVNIIDTQVIVQARQCNITLIQPETDLDNVVLYFDLNIDLTHYTCDNINVIPMDSVRSNLQNVVFAGYVNITTQLEPTRVNFQQLSLKPVSGYQVENIYNNIQVYANEQVVPMETLEQSLVQQNQTQYHTVQVQAFKRIENGELVMQTHNLAVMQVFDIKNQTYEAARSVVQKQLVDEFMNINTFKLLYYGADIYGFVNENIVPVELVSQPDQYIIMLGKQKMVYTNKQFKNCSTYVQTHDFANTCKNQCAREEILVDDTFCIGTDNFNKDNYIQVDGKYYYYYQQPQEAIEGECPETMVLFEEVCLPFCPNGFSFQIDDYVCQRDNDTMFMRTQINGIQEATQQCLYYDLENKICLDDCQATLIKPRYCQQIDECTTYKLTEDSNLCLPDCSIFGVEIENQQICQQQCPQDTIQDGYVCDPCFGDVEQLKIVSLDQVCVNLVANQYYAFEEYKGAIVRVQKEDCSEYDYQIDEPQGSHLCMYNEPEPEPEFEEEQIYEEEYEIPTIEEEIKEEEEQPVGPVNPEEEQQEQEQEGGNNEEEETVTPGPQKSNVGAIVGGVIAAIIVIAIIVVLAVYCVTRKNSKVQQVEQSLPSDQEIVQDEQIDEEPKQEQDQDQNEQDEQQEQQEQDQDQQDEQQQEDQQQDNEQNEQQNEQEPEQQNENIEIANGNDEQNNA